MQACEQAHNVAVLAKHGVATEGRALVIRNREKLRHLARQNPLIEELV